MMKSVMALAVSVTALMGVARAAPPRHDEPILQLAEWDGHDHDGRRGEWERRREWERHQRWEAARRAEYWRAHHRYGEWH